MSSVREHVLLFIYFSVYDTYYMYLSNINTYCKKKRRVDVCVVSVHQFYTYGVAMHIKRGEEKRKNKNSQKLTNLPSTKNT